ncbi:hypothetical protein BDD14_4686 [Edaphobacter modestus]|uniref:Uncharacterized protein n=1 Tax=Edaphobacter modestus TaxID=388466 RepID=A0A4Q7YZ59_9BACT|nr:hypothetical protein BDD14_4686 [Edaphobacter modestus]
MGLNRKIDTWGLESVEVLKGAFVSGTGRVCSAGWFKE